MLSAIAQYNSFVVVMGIYGREKNIHHEWEIATDTEEGQGKMLLKKNEKYLKT